MNLHLFLFKKWKNIKFKLFAKELLYKIDDCLTSNDLFYWIDYGTLLGAIREHDFIPHDEDIDISMNVKDANRVPDLMMAYGIKMFAKCECVINGEHGIIQRYTYKGVTFDIYFYFINPNRADMYCYSFYKIPQTEKKRITKVGVEKFTLPYSGFIKIDFLGRQFNIPKEYEKYLLVLYGSNYMKPDPNFSVDSIRYIYRYSFDDIQGTKYSY